MRGKPKPHREILSILKSPAGPKIIRRFWTKVAIAGPNDCWDWTASRAKEGYGWFHFTGKEGRFANRVSWAIANDAEPGDTIIRHRCDRPACVNPAHLVAGTTADNIRDMVERGRNRSLPRPGLLSASSVLSLEQIGGIVDSFRRGETNRGIARRYAVSHSTISRVRSGFNWHHEAAQFGWGPAVAALQRKAAA